jgi:ABC-type amino acid transport substrate-binding protein
VYFISYTAGAVFLGFVALPLMVRLFTPFRYSDVLFVAKDAMVLAFATGKLIVVLPLLVENTEKLFAQNQDGSENEDVAAVDVLYPTAYAFPHVGKLLSMLFVPFAAWFLGNAMRWFEYPTFLSAGLVGYFGGPLVAIPFLLDLMRLPHDMFQLFLLTGVYGERLGDAVGAMHLAVLTLMTASAFRGRLRIYPRSLLRFILAVTAGGVVMIGGLQITLRQTVVLVKGNTNVIKNMELLSEPVDSVVYRRALPNPELLKPGETLLQRIRRRGIIRVGYNEGKLPFAFFNGKGDLVGFDVEMAHALARDLGVTIEFVRFDRKKLAEQIANDDFDVIMSGLVGTLERAQAMQHTRPYLDVTLALVAPDQRVRDFRSLDSLRRLERPRIGFVDLSRGFVGRLEMALPEAELIELPTTEQFFQEDWKELDALLVSAETGSAFSLLHPEFEVVVPDGLRVQLPLFYAIGRNETSMKEFVEHWVALRRKDGTMQELYDHWILGKMPTANTRRWCVIRDVLHWVD